MYAYILQLLQMMNKIKEIFNLWEIFHNTDISFKTIQIKDIK